MSLWASLNSLGSRSWGARVVDRDLESLASRNSLGTLSRHHGAHLATKLGRHLAVDECLLNRCGKLALPTKLSCSPVAAGTFGVARLNSPDGFNWRLRCRSIMTDLQPRPLLRSCFTVANRRRVAHGLQALCCCRYPSLPDELR